MAIHMLVRDIMLDILTDVCKDYRESARSAVMDYDGDHQFFSSCEEVSRQLSPQVTPLTLTHVCRRWKDIVDSTPYLWDTFCLQYKRPPLEGCPSDEKRLRLYDNASKTLGVWLDRGETKPLTIKIDEIFCSEFFSSSGTILDQLLSQSARWKNVNICCPKPGTETFLKLQPVLSQPLPLLELFFLHPIPDEFKDHAITLMDAPNLRTTSLYGTVNLYTPPTGSITTLYMSSLDYKDIINYLRHEKKLVTCNIELTPIDPDLIIPHQPLQHSSLHELSICTETKDSLNDRTIFADILQSLSTPSLRKLFLSASDADTSSGSLFGDTSLFLSRSALPALTSLTISADSVEVNHLSDVLRAVPSLTHLDLRVWSATLFTQIHGVQPIELNSLTSLKIFEHDNWEGESLSSYLLRNFTLPQLQELEVSLRPLCTSPTTLMNLPNFTPTLTISQKYPELQTLNITVPYTDFENSFLTFMKLLPKLKYLQLRVDFPCPFSKKESEETAIPLSSFSTSFMKFLSASFSGPSLSDTLEDDELAHLPMLTELFYQGAAFTTPSAVDALIDTLELRWKGKPGVNKLTSARIFGSGCEKLYESEDVSKRLKALKREGMDLILQ